ncbi:MAG: CapA family protein [Candidatus Saccharibacteria bacterium]
MIIKRYGKQPTHKKNIIKLSIILVILAALITVGVYFFISSVNPFVIKKPLDSAQVPAQVNKSGKLHMAAMGDMLAHDTIIANAKNGNEYNFAKFFQNIRHSYQNADLVFCNQEGLVSGENYGISGYPSFNAPTKFATDLQSGAGCNMVNLANNHMGDKGVDATNATIDNWAALKPLAVSGANKSAADQEKVSFAEVNGIRIGFVAFADFNNNKNTPGYSVNDYHNEALVRRLVGQARENADAVIVSMHWGVEDSTAVSAEQASEAKLLSDLGVDLIIGTGPHVLQRESTIARPDGGQTVVWYSLGNMLSSQLLTKELIGGIAEFDITKKGDKKVAIDNLSFDPTYMHYEWTAAQAAREDLLARKNAMIYLLNNAEEPLSRSLLNTNVSEQRQYVVDIMGSGVTIR